MIGGESWANFDEVDKSYLLRMSGNFLVNCDRFNVFNKFLMGLPSCTILMR